jgi:hypothetical protein
MDCEKFDQHVIDALYDELDELTHAALRRHVEGCSRCAGIFSGLRATREVGVLPFEEPSDELEARILDAVAIAQRKTPWPRKLLRGLAWAGSHAMRPQLAMAALFFLVIGSSLLLLRPKPGTGDAPVRVTENGVPTPEQAEAPSTLTLSTPPPLAAAPTAAAPLAIAAPTAAPASAAEALADDLPLLAEGHAREVATKEGKAAREKDKDSSKGEAVERGDTDGRGDRSEAKLALADARSVRDTSGCASAVGKFDEVGTRFPGTGVAADAMWDAAACHKSMGELDKARQLYLALKSIGGYRERAEQELAMESNIGPIQNQVAARAASKVAAAPPPPAAAAPSPSATSVPAKRPAGTYGSPGKANAAPKRAADVAF